MPPMSDSLCPYVLDGECDYRTAPEPDALLCFCRHDAGEWDKDVMARQIQAMVNAIRANGTG